MTVSRGGIWISLFTRNGLIVLAALTVGLYIAAAATGSTTYSRPFGSFRRSCC
jgi:hypothetical protein